MITDARVDEVLTDDFVELLTGTATLRVVDVAFTDEDEVFFVEAAAEVDVAFTAATETFEVLAITEDPATPLETGIHNAAGV